MSETATKPPRKRRAPAKRAKPPVKTAKPEAKTAAVAEESPIPTPVTAPVSPPVVVTETKASMSLPDLRKQELLAKVVTRSGIPKRNVKPVIEALLSVLGDALEEGRDVNLNPMGKIVIKKSKPVRGGTVLTTRIRLKEQSGQGSETAPDEA